MFDNWILVVTLLSTLSIGITAKMNLRQQRLRDRTATSEDIIYQVYQDIDIGAMDEDDVVSIISPTSNNLYKDTISPTNNPLEDTLNDGNADIILHEHGMVQLLNRLLIIIHTSSVRS